MLTWPQILSSLGKSSDSSETRNLVATLGTRSTMTDANDAPEVSLDFPGQGVSLLFDLERRLVAVFLYLRTTDGFSACEAGVATDGIGPRDTALDLVSRFGLPASRTPKATGRFHMVIPEAVRYDRSDYAFHVSFDAVDGGAVLLTCMYPDPAA